MIIPVLILVAVIFGVAWNRVLLSLLPHGPYVIRAGELVVMDAAGYVSRARVRDDYIVGIATSPSEVLLSNYTATEEVEE